MAGLMEQLSLLRQINLKLLSGDNEAATCDQLSDDCQCVGHKGVQISSDNDWLVCKGEQHLLLD